VKRERQLQSSTFTSKTAAQMISADRICLPILRCRIRPQRAALGRTEISRPRRSQPGITYSGGFVDIDQRCFILERPLSPPVRIAVSKSERTYEIRTSYP
jgi:hypothetical protein